jgi:hypothetical protein
MAATLGKSGIQPPREGWLDPVMTVDILELRIEEKCSAQAKRNQKAPNGHCVNIDARVMARFGDGPLCKTTQTLWERACSR